MVWDDHHKTFHKTNPKEGVTVHALGEPILGPLVIRGSPQSPFSRSRSPWSVPHWASVCFGLEALAACYGEQSVIDWLPCLHAVAAVFGLRELGSDGFLRGDR